MQIDKSKVIDPFDTFAIAEDYCALIDKLALAWSKAENHLDDLILALEKSTGEPAASARLNFRKRKERCKSLASVAFEVRPAIFAEISSILADAADLHWRRNFLLHGKLNNVLHVAGNRDDNLRITSTLYATALHNGRITTLGFDVAAIERLFYKIGNIAGRFCRFTAQDADFATLSSDDILWLRSWILANHPNPTTLPEPQRLPRPFRA